MRNYSREKVRERDNFTCQDCGFRRTRKQVEIHNRKLAGLKGKIKSLDVHHINGLCGKNSKGYDSILDLSGMITLCHRCHYNRPEHKVRSPDFLKKLLARNTKIPPEMYPEIKKRRLAGATLKEIATHYKVSRQRIGQILLIPSFPFKST